MHRMDLLEDRVDAVGPANATSRSPGQPPSTPGDNLGTTRRHGRLDLDAAAVTDDLQVLEIGG